MTGQEVTMPRFGIPRVAHCDGGALPVIAHFYHAWAGGDWQEPATAHAALMREAQLQPDYLMIGLVGTRAQRAPARAWFRDEFPDAEFAEASTGYEAVTLVPLWEWAQQNRSARVLYAHTKGAANRTPLTRPWIQVMDEAVTVGWRHAVTLLDRCDAAGCFLTEPGNGQLFFAGNFWWATGGYLASLAEPGTSSRMEAEWWLGTGNGRLADLCPGYTMETLERRVYGDGPVPLPQIPGITYMQ